MKKYKAHYSQLVMPHHTNNVKTLFGGQLISWMDIAAAKVSYRFLKGSGATGSVTRSIKEVEFKEPIYAGEWVNFEGYVVESGHSSFHIRVDAYAEGRHEEKRLACTASIIMVSVVENPDGSYTKFDHGIDLDGEGY